MISESPATTLKRTDQRHDYIHPGDAQFLKDVLSRIEPREPIPQYVVKDYHAYRRDKTPSETSASESVGGSVADVQRTDDALFDLRIGDNIVRELYEHIDVPVNISLHELSGVELIAEGTYCNLFQATMHTKRLVIKRVRLDSVHEAEAAEDIEREFVLLNQIRHPHIVRLIGAGRDEHHHRFLLLEYLPGPMLADVMGSRKEPQREGKWLTRFMQARGMEFFDAVRCGRDLASALYYLHSEAFYQHRCIHRDLKPDNIAFDAEGRIKIFDFGLAKLIEAWPSHHNTLFKMTGETGTARYMCPEVALHKPYNEKCDVYSFGILLWEMASGKLPFKGMSREDYYQRVVVGGERPPLLAKWPSAFHAVLRGCWAPHPADRMPFREVYNALEVMVEQMEKLRHASAPGLHELTPFNAEHSPPRLRNRSHGFSVDGLLPSEPSTPRLYPGISEGNEHSRTESVHMIPAKARSISF